MIRRLSNRVTLKLFLMIVKIFDVRKFSTSFLKMLVFEYPHNQNLAVSNSPNLRGLLISEAYLETCQTSMMEF